MDRPFAFERSSPAPRSSKAAEAWKDRRPAKAPAPNQDILDLILMSRRSDTLRQRAWIGGSLTVALWAMLLAGVAYLQKFRRSTRVRACSRGARRPRHLPPHGLGPARCVASPCSAAWPLGRAHGQS